MRIVRRSAERLAALALLALIAASQLAAQTAQAPAFSFQTQLQFSHQAGAAAPPAQTVRIYTNPGNLAFTATAATQSGGGWLFVNNGTLQYTGNSGVAGQQDVVITANPIGLVAGTYTGSVTITSGTSVASITVTLVVGAAPALRLDPASVVGRSIEIGRTTQVPVSVTNTSATPISYFAQVIAAEPASAWITVLTPDNALTGQPATIILNGAAIGADRTFATATVRFTPFNGSGAVTMPVSVAVVPGAQLVVSPEAVNFPYQVGFTPPTTRAVNVTSTTQSQLGYTATVVTSTTPWLTLSTTSQATPGTTSIASTTPNPFYLVPNVTAAGPAPGDQEATIRIEAAATNSVRTIVARLTISNSPQLTLTAEPGPFAYTLGGVVPAPQTFSVGTSSFPQQFTVTPIYTSGDQWFTVSPSAGTTPAQVTVTINQTRLVQLGAGTYTGSVRIASATSQVDVPVSLTVSGFALLAVDPVTPVVFEATQGQTPPARSLTVRATDASSQPFNITVEYGTGASNWLLLSKTTGNTGPTGDLITLNVNPQAVTAAGVYEATLVFTPSGIVPGAPAVRIPVRYTVTGTAVVTASVDRIMATQTGNTPPTVPPITLSSTTPGLSFLAVGSPSWVRVTPSSGSIPGSVTVSFDSTVFTPGDYPGSVTISVSGVQTITIPVMLRVQAGSALQGVPSNVTLSAPQGSTTPVTQTLNVTSAGGAINYTTAAASQGNWLGVSPASGTIAATGGTATSITISANPTGLTVGSYTGTVTLNTPSGATPTTTINVTLTITSQAQPQNLTISNSATGISRGVSPGLIVTIRGRNMAPGAPGLLAVVTNGVVQSTLGEVRVLFDDLPAPLLYVGPSGDGQGDQINAVVPYGIGNRLSTRMVVEYRGVRSTPIDLRVVESDPGLFTTNQSGSGQAAILNQNNTVNSVSNAAERGQIIQIFATGEGLVSPAGADGRVITASDIRRPLQPVSVRIGGQPAEVTYAGSAPGSVSGAIQVNARVPQNLAVSAPASFPIDVQVGQAVSQTTATVAIR